MRYVVRNIVLPSNGQGSKCVHGINISVANVCTAGMYLQ